MKHAVPGPIHTGIGGWVFPAWRGGTFYPAGLPQREELAHASRQLGCIEINSTFYGIIYAREGADSELLKANGGPQIYGSVILEGSAKMAGNPTIVFNEAVLNNIRNSPAFVRYGPVPGSWSDALQ